MQEIITSFKYLKNKGTSPQSAALAVEVERHGGKSQIDKSQPSGPALRCWGLKPWRARSPTPHLFLISSKYVVRLAS